MIAFDQRAIADTEAGIRALCSRVRQAPLLEAAEQAQRHDDPAILLRELERARELLDVLDETWRAACGRAGVELDAGKKRSQGLRAALAAVPVLGQRPC